MAMMDEFGWWIHTLHIRYTLPTVHVVDSIRGTGACGLWRTAFMTLSRARLRRDGMGRDVDDAQTPMHFGRELMSD